MAAELRTFSVTIPKGTAETAPYHTQLVMPPRVVRQIRVRVPPGPRGVVGFALAHGSTPVIPYNAGAWIVTDDETVPMTLDGYATSGTWWVTAYNTGGYDHTLSFSFALTLPTGPATSNAGFVPSATLSTSSPAAGGTAVPTPVTSTAPPTVSTQIDIGTTAGAPSLDGSVAAPEQPVVEAPSAGAVGASSGLAADQPRIP